MAILFTILFLISIVCLFLGLIKPSLVIKWGGEDKKTRKNTLKYFGTAFIVLFILIGITAPKAQTKTAQSKQEEKVESVANEEKQVQAEQPKETKKLGWTQENGNWYYYDNDGKAKTGWVKDNNKSYYFNTSGVMQTGWKESNSKWYYLNSNGSMATNTTVDGYQLASDGVMQQKTVEVESSANKQDTSSNSNNSSVTNKAADNSDTSGNKKSETVYITDTGKKYHSIPNCGNTKHSRAATLEEAQSLGLGPCSKCH